MQASAFDFEAIARTVNSPNFNYFWCGITVAYAAWSLLTLMLASRRIRRSLKEGQRTLKEIRSTEEFFLTFESTSQKLAEINILGKVWRRYANTLIAANRSTVGEASFIQASRAAEDYFSPEAIIYPRLDPKTCAAIPSQLTGLGILGTFIGLASGIYLARNGLSGGNMQEISNGLGQLLNGAALAFWTSITGILSSLVFSRLESKLTKKPQTALENFNTRLNSLMMTITEEQMAHSLLYQGQAQTKAIDCMVASLERIEKSRADTNQEMLIKVVSDFKKTLTENAGEEIKHLAGALKQINLALHQTREALLQSGKNMVDLNENASKLFKKNLHEITHQFQSNFQQTTDTIQNTFRHSVKDIALSLEQSTKSMQQALKQPSQELAMSLQGLCEHAKKTGEAWSLATSANIEHTRTIVKTHGKLSEYISPLMETSKALTQATYESQEVVKESNLAARKIAQTIIELDTSNREIRRHWEDYCQRFATADRNLNQSFSQSRETMGEYSQKIKEFTTTLDKQMTRGLSTLTKAVEGLEQTVREVR